MGKKKRQHTPPSGERSVSPASVSSAPHAQPRTDEAALAAQHRAAQQQATRFSRRRSKTEPTAGEFATNGGTSSVSSGRHVSFNLKSNSVVVYSPPQHRKRLEKPVRRFDGTDFDIKAYLRHNLQYLRLPQSSDATSSNTPPDSSSATEDTGSEQQQHLSKSERKKQRRKQRWAEKHKANSGTDEDDDEDSAGSSLADVSLPPIRTPVRVPGLHGILRNDNATPLPPEEQDNLAAKATEEEHEQEGKEEEAEGEEDVAGKNTFERHRQTRKLQHGGRGSESSDDTSGAEQSNSNNCRSRNNDRDDGDNADEREDEGRASSQDDASGTSNRHDQACAAPGNKKRKKKKKKKKGSTPCSDGEGSDGSGQHLLGCADHANDSTQGWQRVKHRGASSPPPPTVTAENGPTENKPANGTTPPQLNEMAGGPAAAADYALPVQPSSPASSITPITPSSPAVRSDHFYTSHRVTVTLYRRNEKADLVRWRVTSTHAAVAGPDWCWGVALPPHNGVCPEAAELRVLSVKLELWLPLAPGTAAVHWGCSGTPMSENDARDFLQGGNVQTGTNEVKTPAVPTANASLAQSSTLPNGGALPVRASLAATTGPTTPPSPPASAGAATADHQPISRCVTFTAAGGVRGLTNLGNTCYMNSVLQCLSHTSRLAEFFGSTELLQPAINTNPKGLSSLGQMATAFATLLRLVWKAENGAVAPRYLRKIVAMRNERFRGALQHDAQEFLEFLLDELHEDVNRVFQKPYVEIPSLTGLQMQEAADLCWQAFRRRDDSVIIDWFQGQYRSHLTCPDCGGESTAFDPFRCLSLPLPPPRVTFNVYILPVFRLTADGGAESMADAAAGAGSMQPLSLRVGPKETTEAIVAALAEQLHIPTAQLELVLWVNGVVRRTLHQAWPWTPATDGETVPGQAPAQPLLLQSVSRDMRTLRLVAYIYPPASAADPEQWCHLKIDQRLLKLPEVSHCGHYCAAGNEAGTGTTPSTPASAGDTSATSSPAPVSFSAMAAVPPTLKRCSRCRQVAYCSVTCQKADYNQHVNQCKRTGATMPSGVPLRLLCPRASITSAILQQGVAAAGCLPLGERVTATLHEYGSNNVFGVVFKPPERLPPVLSIGVTWWYLPSGDKDTDKENTKQKEEEEETEQEGAAADLALDGIDDLEWDVDEEAVRQSAAQAAPQSHELQLEDALCYFEEPEQLSPQDAWYCPTCKSHRQAFKEMHVWRAPEHLVIHLKRFSWRNVLFRDKLDYLVKFPLTGLDLSRFVEGVAEKDAQIFDLCGVVNHYGALMGGHYTAFVKHAVTGQWHTYDDSRVTPMDPLAVVSKAAYILFYQARRRDARVTHSNAGVTDNVTDVNALD